MKEKLALIFSTTISPGEVLLELLVSGLLAVLIAVWFLRRSGYRPGTRSVVRTFLPLTLIMTLLGAVLASSVALALGMVGAMSVVRFRNRIDNPESLVYLFLSIVVGMGCGIGRMPIIGVGVVAILFFLFVYEFIDPRNSSVYRLEIKASAGSSSQLLQLLKAKFQVLELLELSTRPEGDHLLIRVFDADLSQLQSFSQDISSSTQIRWEHEAEG